MITKEQLHNTGLKTSLTNYWKGYRELHGTDPEIQRNPATVTGGVIRKVDYTRMFPGMF